MIVGETIRLTHVETQTDPVTGEAIPFVASLASVVVTAPDGSTLSPAVRQALGSASDEGSNTAVFSFLLTPLLGGAYRCALSYADRDGERITRPLVFFATWTDPSPLLQARLGQALPPEVLEPEFASAARTLLSRFVCVGNPPGSNPSVGMYQGLTGLDQAYFDEAVLLTVCARLVGPLSTGGAASDVVEREIQDSVKTRYADQTRERTAERGSPGDYGAGPGGYGGTNERVRWLREAAEALGKVSCIAQYFQARQASFSPFALSGLTRTQKAMGGGRTLLAQVVDLFTNDYFVEQDYPGGFGYCGSGGE